MLIWAVEVAARRLDKSLAITRERFDIVVIGGGTGGYVAALRAAQLGLKTALVERDKVGGVCLHRGCIPTKALLNSADYYSLLQRAPEFGFGTGGAPSYDYPKIRQKVDSTVSQLYKGVQFLLKKKGVTVFSGHATLERPGLACVQSEGKEIAELGATSFLLSTGSHWRELSGLPIAGSVMDADAALQLQEIPKSVVIIGAGQTGVEFASFYRAFGAEVHLIEAGPRLLPAEDAEVSGQLEKMLARRGINLYLNTTLEAKQVTVQENSVQLDLIIKDKPKNLKAEKMLLAIGREANTKNFGLENWPGVKLDKAGFVQTGPNLEAASNLYAVGDMTGGFGFSLDEAGNGPRYLLAHTSSAQGIYVVEKLAGKNPDSVNYSAVPRCTYSNPQVASLGLTEREARDKAKAAGKDEKTAVKVGKFPFKANGQAMMQGETEGFVKIVADTASGDLLGVHITGPKATELIAEPGLAKLFDGSAWELAQAIRPHPALTEVIMEAARDVDGWAIHL